MRCTCAGKLAPPDWGNNAGFDPVDGLVPNPGGQLWLIEMLAPFHTEQNNHRQQMLADLLENDFSGQSLKTIQVDQKSGLREVIDIKGVGYVKSK
jgi:hypothetical protein